MGGTVNAKNTEGLIVDYGTLNVNYSNSVGVLSGNLTINNITKLEEYVANG